jgi:hypothetical protein
MVLTYCVFPQLVAYAKFYHHPEDHGACLLNMFLGPVLIAPPTNYRPRWSDSKDHLPESKSERRNRSLFGFDVMIDEPYFFSL